MQPKPDWSLRVRMLAAMAGMAVLYAAFVGVAAWWATDAFGSTGLLLVVGVAGVLVALQYKYAPDAALRALGADRVSRAEYPDLHARVNRLASQAGVPKPDVAVSPQTQPNAFATAKGRDDAVVAVTEGLLDTLQGDELDAVLAHEIAHVKHRDALIMSVVTALVTVAAMVVRNFWWFGDGGGDGAGGGDGGMPWFLAFVAVSMVAWIGGYLVSRAISRQREYAADRGAAVITGKPAAMAAAIETITAEMAATPERDLRDHAELNALFIVPADAKSRVVRMMETHPDPDERVERLSELTGEFERA
ncbi:M48 family metalloprotease [Halosimplex pelagicum]|uniref:Protease HtpX homolog n=1 Tax=Halosimplex pelagicum TaxID=869886 RepID=A0A7D5P9M7_9EURY|nr:M48 family metalloprotease [Halosimplex pelagicum]QLH82781.1 M48 family metalloprotease [Halosimplex pelagicum]